MFKKLIGTRSFYKMVLTIVFPIIIQNGITNFVGLLDNIMIGQLGTLSMSGVSITNQLLSVFNIVIFGAMSGPGIFLAQFYGNHNHRGIQETFHFKYYIGILIVVIALMIFLLFGHPLISLYLTGNEMDTALTLGYSLEYLHMMLIGLFPFMLSQIYSSTLRETGDTLLPMLSATIALFTNFILNYLLIFGHLGLPALGIKGAALATVISRYVECLLLILFAHSQTKKHPYLKGIYSFFSIQLQLMIAMIKKSFPLLCNEILWAITVAAITQCYSTRGLDAIAAYNITQTLQNTFMIVCYAMGNAISIIVGQQLGANHIKEALDIDLKLIFFNFCLSAICGTLLFSVSNIIPNVYNTSLEVKQTATSLLKVCAILIPVVSVYYGSYFTMRAGGKTILTFLFDSAYSTLINLPVALLISRMTLLPILPLYTIVQLCDLPKAIVGIILVSKGVWINNLVSQY